jgi:branched-chain amino acid transport system permease protein
MDASTILLQVVVGIASGMLIFLVAAGCSIIMSGMNILNFGQGAFFLLGSFMCWSIAREWNFWWALLIGPVVVAAIGFLAEILLRPLYRLNMLFQLLLTMGIMLVMTGGMELIWGTLTKTVATPDPFDFSVPILGADFPAYYLFIIGISVVLAVGIWFMFEKTKLGMTFRAIISDRQMVDNLGINVTLLFSIMFMFGVALSGVAGVLMAPVTGIVTQNAMSILFTVIIVLVIGGITSMRGALLSALIVGLANSLGSLFLPWFYTLIPATLMIIILLIKPKGLFVND